MASALLLMTGSRGDHEPMFALAVAMVNSGKFKKVHMCVHSEYLYLVPKDERIVPHTLHYNRDDFVQIYVKAYKEHLAKKDPSEELDPVLLQLECIDMISKECIVPGFPSLHKIAQDVRPSVIVATTLIAFTALGLAESLNVPFWFVNFQPITPTSAFPYLASGVKNAQLGGREAARLSKNPNSTPENPGYMLTYDLLSEGLDEALQVLNSFREPVGLSALSSSDFNKMRCGRRENTQVLNSYVNALAPVCPDWSENIHVAPAMADDYLPPNWIAEENCPLLCAYLKEGEKPFCVNFGSMNLLDKTYTTRELFNALQRIGLKRVLIIKGDADIGAHNLDSDKDEGLCKWAAENVFVSDEEPQNAWLMPKCSGILCHGGAGTTAVSLRAGIPISFAPYLSDQYFWAEACKELGVASIASPGLQEANSKSFESAIREILTDDLQKRAAQLGQNIRSQGSGSEAAANLIAKISLGY